MAGQRIAGNFTMSDDGHTAFVWTKTSWAAQFRIERRDMAKAEFDLIVAQVVEMVKRLYGRDLTSK